MYHKPIQQIQTEIPPEMIAAATATLRNAGRMNCEACGVPATHVAIITPDDTDRDRIRAKIRAPENVNIFIPLPFCTSCMEQPDVEEIVGKAMREELARQFFISEIN